MEFATKGVKVFSDTQDYITPQQAAYMCVIAEQAGRHDHALLLRTLSETGRRVSEIVGQKPYEIQKLKHPHPPLPGFRPQDIDPSLNVGYFFIGKKHSEKLERLPFPLMLSLVTDLLAYARAYHIPDNKPFFSITRQHVGRLVKKYAQGIILYPDAQHPHAFRHGWGVTAAMRAQTPDDLMAIQRQLCHANIATTQGYMRFSTVSLRNLMERVLEKKQEP